MELERERRKGVRVKYLPRSFLWNVLAVTLAFLLGLFFALAGLLGVGFFFLAKPINTFIPNYELYLREDYAKKSFLDLTGDVTKLVQEIAGGGGEFTLSTIDEITPALKNSLSPLTDSLAGIGVEIDLDTFMATPLSGIGPYFKDDVLMKTQLGKVLGVAPGGNSLMLSLCYGEEGTDYTLQETENGTEIVMNEGKSPTTIADLLGEQGGLMDKFTVEAVLGVSASSNAAMRYLAYGTEGTNYKIENVEGEDRIVMLVNPLTQEPFRKKKISDLIADGATAIDDAKISDLIDTGSDSGILNAIKDWRIADLKQQARIERLKIGQVVDLGGATSRLMKAIADWRIKDLTDQKKIDSLTLGDVLEVDESSPQLLRALADTPIGEIGEKANNLRLGDLIDAGEIAGNKLLKNLGRSSLSTLAEDIANLSVKDVFSDEMYLHMPVKEGKYASYRAFLDAYDHSAEDHAYMPYVNPDPDTVAEYTELYRYQKGSAKAPLLFGFLGEKDGQTAVFEDGEVYGKSGEYYAEQSLTVTPVYTYKRVDFENGGAAAEADYAAELRGGYINGNVYGEADEAAEGHAYVRENGEIVRYYPEKEEWADPAGTRERRCYPLLSDGYGVYCIIATLDGKQVRVDFDEVITGYTAGGQSLTLGENGGAMYEGKEKTVYSVHAEDGSVTRHIVLRIPVEEGYYEEENPSVNTLGSTPSDGLDAGNVETYWTATWTEAGVQHENEEVDRYLDGIWYLLLGGTVYGDDGKVQTIIDKSDTPVLDMASLVTDTAALISETPLWELYLHGVIKADPYSVVHGVGHNLNELTITQVIAYAKDPGGFSWGS